MYDLHSSVPGGSETPQAEKQGELRDLSLGHLGTSWDILGHLGHRTETKTQMKSTEYSNDLT
jgi:hypothetical protein